MSLHLSVSAEKTSGFVLPNSVLRALLRLLNTFTPISKDRVSCFDEDDAPHYNLSARDAEKEEEDIPNALSTISPCFKAIHTWIADFKQKKNHNFLVFLSQAAAAIDKEITPALSPAPLRILHGFHAILSAAPDLRTLEMMLRDMYGITFPDQDESSSSSSTSSSSEEEEQAKRKTKRRCKPVSSSSDEDDELPKKRPARKNRLSKKKEGVVVISSAESSSSSSSSRPAKKKQKKPVEIPQPAKIEPWVHKPAYGVAIDAELFKDWADSLPKMDPEALQKALQDVACRMVAARESRHFHLAIPRLIKYCRRMAKTIPAYSPLADALDECTDVEEPLDVLAERGALVDDALPDSDADAVLWQHEFDSSDGDE
jgi:hypothetical protein